MIKKIVIIVKFIRSLCGVVIFGQHRRLSDDELIHRTRILIHALEKAKDSMNLTSMAFQLVVVGKYVEESTRRDLLSTEEIEWGNRVLYGGFLDKTPYRLEETGIDALIKSRRSIRKYSPERVCPEIFLRIAESVTWAPSACNRQPIKIIQIQKKESMTLLASFKEKWIAHVPQGLLVLANSNAYDEKDVKYTPYLDAGIAMQNICLTLHDCGLGSCIVNLGQKEIGNKQRAVLYEHFNISSNWIIVALIPFGYSSQVPPPPGRKDPSNIIAREEIGI